MRTRIVAQPVLMLLVLALAAAPAAAQEYKSGIVWPEPPVVTPPPYTGPVAPPEDAIVLFDGTNLDAFHGGDAWKLEDGVAIVSGRDIVSRQSFGDCHLHVEWAAPAEVKGNGQGRGNSGVFLMDRYEIQILDSYQNPTYYDGQCGALYKQRPPLVNACRKPGEWQTFDIFFRAPRFKDGKLVTPGYVTVLHNGVLIQNNTRIEGVTSWTDPPTYHPHPARQPLRFQNHGDPVRFRSIWIRDLMDREDANDAAVAKRQAELEAAAEGPVEAPPVKD